MTPQKLTSSRGLHPRRRRALSGASETMRILAIETSCDETAVAIIEDGTKILSNVVVASMQLHEKTGGIIPEVAAREQVKCIIPVIKEAVKTPRGWPDGLPRGGGIMAAISNIDALAVTVGPGLNGSLLVGVETAKTIAFITGKPIIPVNHIYAHIYANWLYSQLPSFPTIALVVSGGHTELFLMTNHDRIKWLGGTLDDAAGEAFDKTARILGLGFPGGPAISAAAEKFKISNFPPCHRAGKFQINKLPRPMIDSKNLNFSFSGLKTAVIREINRLKSLKQLNNNTISYLAHEIQESITDVLVKKTIEAAKIHKVKSILLGGGVAANKRLREKFQITLSNLQPTTYNPQLFIPPPPLCTDNAAYIGSFAFFHDKPQPWQKIQAKPDLTVEE